MSPEEFVTIITKAAAAYRERLTDLELEAYADELGHLEPDELRSALRQYRDTGKPHFPRVPELLAFVRPVADDQDARWRRIKRGALERGFVPVNWTPERLADERAALGLGVTRAALPQRAGS